MFVREKSEYIFSKLSFLGELFLFLLDFSFRQFYDHVYFFFSTAVESGNVAMTMTQA